MIQRILNSSRTFTYLPANPSSAAGAGDNTIALQAILKEVELLPGGRYLVEAKLGARVKVLEQFGITIPALNSLIFLKVYF